jgi:hypothetical protein
LLVGLVYDIEGGKEYITPIYLTREGITHGGKYGNGNQAKRISAKEGYAIGGLIVNAKTGLRGGFQIVFMKIIPTGLNPKLSYTSPWLGKPIEAKKVLCGDGRPVIGIYGRARQLVNAVGLVQPKIGGSSGSSGTATPPPATVEKPASAVSSTTSSKVTTPALSSRLIGTWDFTTGRKMAGTNNGGRLGVEGRKGQGIAFEARSGADFQLPASLTAGLKKFTFAFWIRTREGGAGNAHHTHPTMLGNRTGGQGSGDFGITTKSGRIGYWAGLGSGDKFFQSPKVRINDGNWHHVALASNGVRLLLYVDGSVVYPEGLPAGKPLNKMAVHLGSTPAEAKFKKVFHSGVYDELRLYNGALSSEQLKALYGSMPGQLFK